MSFEFASSSAAWLAGCTKKLSGCNSYWPSKNESWRHFINQWLTWRLMPPSIRCGTERLYEPSPTNLKMLTYQHLRNLCLHLQPQFAQPTEQTHKYWTAWKTLGTQSRLLLTKLKPKDNKTPSTALCDNHWVCKLGFSIRSELPPRRGLKARMELLGSPRRLVVKDHLMAS